MRGSFPLDKFIELFFVQSESDDGWIDKARFKADPEYRKIVTTTRLLDIHEEVTEMKNSLGVSQHKLKQHIDSYNVKMQIVDVLKYTIGLAGLLDYTATDIHEAFLEKSSRLKSDWAAQRLEMTEKLKVVCIDIDGVVANYEKEYLSFCEGQGYSKKSVKGRSVYSFRELFNISRQLEEKLYAEFVSGGGFRYLEVYEGALEIINWIKEVGMIPVFITARPNWKYQCISQDTQFWKDENGFGDILTLFDKDKADAIINHIHPAHVIAFIEDRDKHAIEIAHMGVKVFLINRSYNLNFSTSDFNTIQRVGDWEQIKKFLQMEMK